MEHEEIVAFVKTWPYPLEMNYEEIEQLASLAFNAKRHGLNGWEDVTAALLRLRKGFDWE